MPKIYPVEINGPLIEAVEHDNLDYVKTALEKGASPNAIEKDSYKRSALIMAASRGNLDIITCLLEAGADPNLADTYQQTPLMYFVRECNEHKPYLAILDLLIKYGSDINAVDRWATSALVYALTRSHSQCAIYLASQPNINFNGMIFYCNAEGWTPLIFAAKYGTATVLDTFILRGVDIHAPSSAGKSVIEFAALSRVDALEKVSLLIAKGANEENLYKLDKQGRGKTRLMYAIKWGDEALISKHLNDSNLDAQDEEGRTALMYACDSNNLLAVTKLIDHDVDVNVLDNHGENALFYTTKVAIWEALKDAEIDFNVISKNRNTFILHVLSFADNEQLNFLDSLFQARKISTKIINVLQDTKTALFHACEKATDLEDANDDRAELYKKLIHWLLKCGADPKISGERYSLECVVSPTIKQIINEYTVESRNAKKEIQAVSSTALMIASRQQDELLRKAMPARENISSQQICHDSAGRVRQPF